MKVTMLGGLEARITGGVDGEGGGAGPLVVCLHGFGAPGDDLVALGPLLARSAPAGTRFVFPEAPIDLGPTFLGGRAWWWIDIEARLRRQMMGEKPNVDEVPEGLVAARARVTECLADVERVLAPPPGKLVLAGFSQGAMLALDVALHVESPLAGLVLMSPTHIAAAEWQARLAKRRGLAVLLSHGKQDELLSFEITRGLRTALLNAGLDVTWVPFEGGHGIPPEVLTAAAAFIGKILS